ncbi:ATP-grasp domain-containing protein [Streptomyces neyagawaensis]|uniref:ATP-grasp domain-containing protein n=1 Tax=Streptomyces neyagawaensis TaxID=42238 RepID=UPI0006E1C376|nr:ATP-grasp domain-containing protein [Streptomyces neyagawaensis]MCL6731401.1 ATP-grasp domain-containing protein [Streptomyces neyagawaensis]MDE1683475.1 ATP-grasp domain-containing protein [Streptomyces neyagawaensis]
MQRHVILVDPYSEAAEFANAFRARGVASVAVLSTPAPLKSYLHGWKPESFSATHFHDGDFAKLVETVRGYDPVAVIPGNEHAVRLVDALVEELFPGTGNVPELSAARRDKWPMAQAVANAGIPHLRTFAAATEEEAADWLRETGLEGRALVLKPRCSGGTDGVHKVEAGEDWRPSFRRLLGSVNMFDLTNDSILVQEFASGTEFVVDTYSVDGELGLVAVVRYSKSARGARIGVYDAEDYLLPEDPLVKVLEAYTRQVAEAVGIRTGCTHTEIMLTDQGPRLIEIAARLDGGCAQQAARLATGDSQIDRTVRHHLDSAFSPGYEIVQPTRVAWLSAANSGIMRNAEVLDSMRDLASFQKLGCRYPNGSRVPKTEDLFTTLGWVLLSTPDQDVLDEDTQRVREIEAKVEIEPLDP